MATWKMLIKKPFIYRGTCLQGTEVTVIKEEIREGDKWACKIRVMERPGAAADIWIYDRELLVPSGELAKAIFI